MADAPPLTLRRIDPAAAAERLAGFERFDATGTRGAADVAAMCQAGECFELAGEAASAVYVVSLVNGTAWVQALQGRAAEGVDLLTVVDAIVSQQAQGAAAVGFQTGRRGMVRQMQRRGYRVAGWLLRKEL